MSFQNTAVSWADKISKRAQVFNCLLAAVIDTTTLKKISFEIIVSKNDKMFISMSTDRFQFFNEMWFQWGGEMETIWWKS